MVSHPPPPLSEIPSLRHQYSSQTPIILHRHWEVMCEDVLEVLLAIWDVKMPW